MKRIISTMAVSLGLITLSPLAHADGYQIAKANDCFKCHDVSKDKKGPSFQYISNAYRGRSGRRCLFTVRITLRISGTQVLNDLPGFQPGRKSGLDHHVSGCDGDGHRLADYRG